MSQKIYLNILKCGIYFSLISVFLVYKRLLFPFITSKQIFFNIVMEILLIIWLTFIIKYPEYRPRLSWISYGLISFFSVLIISCFTGVDFNLSFWGDIERMLGVFHLLHFLIFYFIAITVFRKWSDWQTLFIISILFAVIVSLNGIANKNYGTIGNTAYVGGYLIFNIYFSLILFFKSKIKSLRWLLVIPVFIMLLEFRVADVSGAYVGFGTSLLVLLFAYGILNKNKKVKIGTVALSLLLVFTIGYLFTHKNSEFVQNTPSLRLVRDISLQKNTFQTRLISWKTALKDFKNHPWLGTGHGNFAITFDKYFDPTFYNHTRQETYFDRAHNNLIDIASTTGALGLATYLSIFAAVAFYLIKGYRDDKINKYDFLLVSCLIIAYFIQNLAVFDSLVTYISLMIILSYIYWLNKEGEEGIWEKTTEKAKKIIDTMTKDQRWENKEIYALVFIGILILAITYQYNVKPLQMLMHTIDGQIAFARGDIEGTLAIYKKALSYQTILDRDSRTSFIQILIPDPNLLKPIEKSKRQEILTFAISLAKDNVAYNENDSLSLMMLSQILNIAAGYNSDDPIKFREYSEEALSAIDKSIAASPGRVPIYFQKAQIYLTRGDKERAIETLKYADSLNIKYYDSSCYLGKILLFFKQDTEAYQYLDRCIDLNGLELLVPVDLTKMIINHYIDQKDWPRVAKLYEKIIELEPQTKENYINLTNLYAKIGEKAKAKIVAEKLLKIDSNLKEYIDDFINSLE